MTTPVKPAPSVTPGTVLTVTTKKHGIKPLTGGTTYTATSFEVAMMIDSKGSVSPLRVSFYDANDKPIPDGAIKPVSKTPGAQSLQAVLQLIVNSPGNAGETLGQHLLRAASPYVQTTYGAQLIAG